MRSIFIFGAAIVLMAGLEGCTPCHHHEQPAQPPAGGSSGQQGMTAHQAGQTYPEEHQPTTLVGVLQSRPNSKDQTGWVLIGDGSTGSMRVDISHVRDVATSLDGKRVRLVGHMLAEPAGMAPTLVADSIVSLPTPKPGQ